MKFKLFLQFALLIITSAVITQTSFAKTEPLDGIAAIVGNGVITQSELNQRIDEIKQQITATQTTMPTPEALHKQVLDQLINKKVQLQLAEQMGITVNDTDLDKAIKEIAQNNKMSVTELLQKVNEQGLTTPKYRKELQEEILLQRVQQQSLGSKLSITPQEVDDFMHSKSWQTGNTKEYHLEDILIALPEAPSPQDLAKARNYAEEITEKLRHGTNFHDAAAAESGNQNTALQGGDLGWRKLAEIPSAFVKDLPAMKVNDISNPIQTPNGFHIIRLTGVRNASDQKAPDRKQVEQLIYQRKLEEALQSWITKIRSEIYINTHVEA